MLLRDVSQKFFVVKVLVIRYIIIIALSLSSFRALLFTFGTFAILENLFVAFFLSIFNSIFCFFFSDLLIHPVCYHREVVVVTNSSRLSEYCVQGTSIPSPR